MSSNCIIANITYPLSKSANPAKLFFLRKINLELGHILESKHLSTQNGFISYVGSSKFYEGQIILHKMHFFGNVLHALFGYFENSNKAL